MKTNVSILTNLIGKRSFAPACLLIAAVTPALADSYSDAIMADNPLIYYRYQDTGSTVTDLGSGDVDGTVFSGATQGVSAGPVAPLYPGFQSDNKGITFNGSSSSYVSVDTVSLGNAGLEGASAVTVEFWLNPTSYSTGVILDIPLGKAGFGDVTGIGVNISTDGNVRLSGRSNGNDSFQQYTFSDTGIGLNEWSQVTAIFDYTNDTVSLYVNGLSIGVSGTLAWGSSTLDGVDIATTDTRQGISRAGINPFEGALDELSIYNYGLSSTEIADHYAAAIPESSSMSLLMGSVVLLALLFHRVRRV